MVLLVHNSTTCAHTYIHNLKHFHLTEMYFNKRVTGLHYITCSDLLHVLQLFKPVTSPMPTTILSLPRPHPQTRPAPSCSALMTSTHPFSAVCTPPQRHSLSSCNCYLSIPLSIISKKLMPGLTNQVMGSIKIEKETKETCQLFQCH